MEVIQQTDVQPVLTEIRDGVGIISLNRPERHNALDLAARAALADAFRWARETPEVRAVLLRGEGRSFCSGRDRENFLDPASHGSHFQLIEEAQNVTRDQANIGKPSICAMRGHVIGAGAELALVCDMRIAADDLRYSFPEVGFGIIADTGSSHLLTTLLGPARAKWLFISGERIGADDAVRWGLAEWTVSAEELDAKALEKATLLASRPPLAACSQKRLVDAVHEGGLDAGLRREMIAQLELFHGAEFARVAAEKQPRATAS